MNLQEGLFLRTELNEFLYGFRDCIKTRPSRHHLHSYVLGQLSNLERKSVEPIALETDENPRTLQQFMSYHRWDEEKVRVRVQEIIARDHSASTAIGVIDETTFAKKGVKTAGVQRQYCGSTGKIENCVASVHLGYVTGDFHALVESELFIPQEWIEDSNRRAEAMIPENLMFRTKLEIAIDLIDRARGNGIELQWLTADELYGRSAEFRHRLLERGLSYVVEIPFSLTGWTKMPRFQDSRGGRGKRLAPGERRNRPVANLWKRGGPSWEHFRVKDTEKGPEVWNVRTTRFYPREDGLPGEPHLLIIAENVITRERKYFLAHAPEGTTTETILHVTFSRWHIERLFQDCKGEVGLDHFEVRNYVSLNRHLILSMVSILFLVIQTRRLKKTIPKLHFAKCASFSNVNSTLNRPAKNASGEFRKLSSSSPTGKREIKMHANAIE